MGWFGKLLKKAVRPLAEAAVEEVIRELRKKNAKTQEGQRDKIDLTDEVS